MSELFENKFYVYAYLDPRKSGEYKYGDYKFNFEPFYIGKGESNRYLVHMQSKKLLKKHPVSQKINKIATLGHDLKNGYIIKIKENLSEQDSFNLEILLIKTIGRKDLKQGPLLNLSNGGEGPSGFKHTEEQKIKIGLASKGKKYALGNRMSEETKRKMSETKKRLGVMPRPTVEQRRLGSEKTGNKLRGISRPEWVREKIRKGSIGKIVSEETRRKLSDCGKKFKQEEVDKIFNEYIRDNVSLSSLSKKYEVVPSVMFGILHEIRYKCSDASIAKLAKEKLLIRHSNKKFNQNQIDDICKKYLDNLSIKDISKEYLVSEVTIYHILKQKFYSCSDPIIKKLTLEKIAKIKHLTKEQSNSICEEFWIKKNKVSILSKKYNVNVRTIYYIINKNLINKDKILCVG